MKKQIAKFLSILITGAMMLAGFGATALATGGTGDASLSSLEVSPGTLSPEFSSDCYEYSVEVGEDCDKLLVNAQTTDGGAKAVIAGNSGLKAGANSVIINVTAADGVTTAKYTIQVTRGAAGEGAGAQGNQTAPGSQLGGGVANSPLISGNLPGAQQTVGETDAAADGETPESGENTAQGGSLEDGSVPGSGEIPETGINQGAAGAVASAGRTYTLSVPDAAMVPTGFQAAEILIGGQTVPVWQFPSNYEITGQYLIYGTNPEGKTTFYIYDESEGTVITAAAGLMSIGQEGEISQNQLRSAQQTYQKSLKSRMMVILCLSVACFILLIALTASLTRRKHGEGTARSARSEKPFRREVDDEDDFYGDDDDLYGEDGDDDLYEADGDDDLYGDDDDDSFYGGDGDDDLYGDDENYDDPGEGAEVVSGGEIDALEDDDNDIEDIFEGSVTGEGGPEQGVPLFEGGKREESGEESPSRSEEQKKKLLTAAQRESEEETPVPEEAEEWDTAPLPNLEDTGKLELVRQKGNGEPEHIDSEEEPDEEPGDVDSEEPDEEPGDLDPKEPDVPPVDDDLEEPDMEPEDVDSEEPDEEPGDDGLEETDMEADDAGLEDLDLEDLDLAGSGFEEITLEDVGPEVIQAEEAKERREPEPVAREMPLENEVRTEKHQGVPEKETWSREESDAEREEMPLLPEEEGEEEMDLDAEFDLLDALLSDSVRGGRPEKPRKR